MRVPFTSVIVAPLWIMSVGIVAALGPPAGVVTGVFLLLVCVIVVPVIITSLLWSARATFEGGGVAGGGGVADPVATRRRHRFRGRSRRRCS